MYFDISDNIGLLSEASFSSPESESLNQKAV